MLHAKFRMEKLCLVKHFAFRKNVCYQYYILGFEVLFVLLWAAVWPTTNSLWMYCYFPVIRLVNLILSGPCYSSHTVTTFILLQQKFLQFDWLREGKFFLGGGGGRTGGFWYFFFEQKVLAIPWVSFTKFLIPPPPPPSFRWLTKVQPSPHCYIQCMFHAIKTQTISLGNAECLNMNISRALSKQ